MIKEISEKRLATAIRKVVILEKMVEDSSRSLYLEKERIHNQASFMGKIIESIAYPFYVIDVCDYTVKLANQAARRGFPSEDTTCHEMMYKRSGPCEGEGMRCPLKKVLETNKPITMEHVRYDKNDIAEFFEVHAYPILDDHGKVTQMIEYIEDITRRKRVEERSHQKVLQLLALRSIDMAINASLDLRVTLGVVLDQVRNQLNVDASDILLYSPYLNTFEFLTGRGFRTSALQYTNLCLGEGYAGKAARERRTVYVQDINEDGGLIGHSEKLKNEGFVSYYGVPLISKGEVKGVMEVFGRRRIENDKEWTGLLEILAGQAAIALDNSTMLDTIQRDHAELLLAYDSTIDGWARALDMRDKETEGHSRRVMDMTVKLARAFGFRNEDLAHIRRGSLLHDIGKLGVPDSILLKPAKLSEKEWRIMSRHPELAYKMLSPIEFLRPAIDIPYCHHEKWDGTGYPRGLKGDEIPFSARIFAVVDIFDALGSDRPYRPAWSKEKIIAHLEGLAGSQLDPRILDVFFKMLRNGEIAA